MPTCAEVVASTLRDAGVERMFGLPGGEILDFIEAARKVGIEFVLVRHEAVAAFMADVAGQIARQPAVCVSTLGPGAMNLTLGVANAYLDRSPLIAITATMSTAAAPYATHQQLDLNAVYRAHPALWSQDTSPGGYSWVQADDRENNVIAFLQGRPRNRVV